MGESPGWGQSALCPTQVVREDEIPDDLAVVARLADGLVVVTVCSHAGVINTIRRGREVTGVAPVRGVAGGFHLVRASGDRIAGTVEGLEGVDAARIVSGHCTGAEGQFALRLRFGDRFTPLVTGATFRF